MDAGVGFLLDTVCPLAFIRRRSLSREGGESAIILGSSTRDRTFLKSDKKPPPSPPSRRYWPSRLRIVGRAIDHRARFAIDVEAFAFLMENLIKRASEMNYYTYVIRGNDSGE